MYKPVVGTCTRMCPDNESLLRRRTKRLSYFEVNANSSDDLSLCVKEYTRSAAGSVKKPEELRTPSALKKTVKHLFSFLNLKNHGRNLVYTTNFISDRLRAVRQDIVIQQLSWKIAIPILEQTIRYHIFLKYMLHREDLKSFDPVLNEQILRSYFTDLKGYYEDSLESHQCNTNPKYTEERNNETMGVKYNERLKTQQDDNRKLALRNYYEFNTYYVLLNLCDSNLVLTEMKDFYCKSFIGNNYSKGNEDFTSQDNLRVIPENRNNKSRLIRAFSVATLFHTRFYYQFFKKQIALNFLESSCLLYLYSDVRTEFLKILNTAYNSKHFYFSKTKLVDWLGFDSEQELKVFLDKYNIKTDSEDKVFFTNKQILENSDSEREKHEFAKNFSYGNLVESKNGFSSNTNDLITTGISVDN